MPIYEITPDKINPIPRTTFAETGLSERNDLQRLLRDRIEILSPDTLVIAEEFSDWDDSKCRIDLLGIDRDAKIVVIELKRTEDGGHMELQALRYAAMVSTMTFERAVKALAELRAIGADEAQAQLLEFLVWPRQGNGWRPVRPRIRLAEFQSALAAIPQIHFEGDADGRPRFSIGALADPASWDGFTEALGSLVRGVRAWYEARGISAVGVDSEDGD